MCTYQTPDGKPCPRPVVSGVDHCSLHYGFNRSPDDDLPENPWFQTDFARVIAAQAGDWRGFVFPRGVALPQQVDFEVDARGCQFSAFDQGKVVFKKSVNFSDSIFRSGMVVRGVVFEGDVRFERCRFGGPVDLLNVQCKKDASFYRAEFSGRAIFRINFAGSANLNEVLFREAVSFAGWRNYNMRLGGEAIGLTGGTVVLGTGQEPTFWQRLIAGFSAAWERIKRIWGEAKRRATRIGTSVRDRYERFRRRFARSDPNVEIFRVFGAEGQLQDAVFMQPEQTLFSGVDLARVFFRGTNLRGVRFLGVNWWQPKLRRNGLYDELSIRYSSDGPFRYQSLPVLEETCRNVRVALEESRSFNVASDFYIAEMEAARARLPFFQRHLFSVQAAYRFVSRYGTSVATAVRVLASLFLLHMGMTIWLRGKTDVQLLIGSILDTGLRSLKILVPLQGFDRDWMASSGPQAWIDTVFRVLGLIQIAMLVIAFRARIKRH
jgi:uncharacterized protein YjbI with pentapeptide repeats